MERVCVCMLLYGNRQYFRTGRLAILSLLKYTNFNLFLTLKHEQYPLLKIPANSRIHIHLLKKGPASSHRAQPFLLKFKALEACLHHMAGEWLMMMDADALVVSKIDQAAVEMALNGRGIGMAEQTTIKGSGMTRYDFRDHYTNHSLAWFDSAISPPHIDDFRYFNSGVILGRRSEFSKLVSWAINIIDLSGRDHQVGNHMIADQDYFQFWVNNLHPGSCTPLSWRWNHCQHWDNGFPRPGAFILHFSNFCRGPGLREIMMIHFFRTLLRLKESIFGS